MATFAGTAEVPAQVANSATSVGLYGFHQKGELQQFELSGSEVIEVDSNGKGVLRKLGGGVGQALRLAGRPARDAKACHLVFYPIGKEHTEANRRVMRNRMIVELEEGASAEALAAELGATSSRLIPGSPARVLLTFGNAVETIDKISAAQNAAGAVSAEPMFARTMTKRVLPTEENPLDGDPAWHLKNFGIGGTEAGTDINVEDAWDVFGVTGTGVSIGMVDDGIEDDHPDLMDNILGGFNWNGVDAANFRPVLATDDHGTAMAGLAAAVGDNTGPIVGVAYEAGIYGLRLTGAPFDEMDEEEALGGRNGDHIPASMVDISCNSWGPSDLVTDLDGPGSFVVQALQKGVADGRGGDGIIYVWSAGNGAGVNDNSNYDGYANLPETIAVGAIDDSGDKAVYSEPGANLVVSAPSGGGTFDLTTTNYRGEPIDPAATPLVYPNPSERSDISGTSASAALVSGVVALMLEANPDLGWRDVQEILMKTAAKFPVRSTFTAKAGTLLTDANVGIDFTVALGGGGIYYVVPDNGMNMGLPTRVLSWTTNTLTTADDFGSDATWTGEYTIQTLVRPDSGEWTFNAAGYHFHHGFGAGLVNATEAVREALARPLPSDRLAARDPSLPLWQFVGEAAKIPGTECDHIVEFDLSAMDNYRVEHVQINMTVVHTRRSDLDIRLISPNGTQSILAETHTNGTDQSIVSWTFGTVRHWGEGSQGTWVLRIKDLIAGEVGFLNNVSLLVHGVKDTTAPVSQDPLVISDRVLEGVEGESLTYELEVVGASSVAIAPLDLPPGLIYTPDPVEPQKGGMITGTPTEAGLFVTNVNMVGTGGPATETLSFVIQPISSSLGDAALHEDEDPETRPSTSGGSGGTWLFEFLETNGDSDSVGSPLNMEDNQWSQIGFSGVTVPSPAVVTCDWFVDSQSVAADLLADPPVAAQYDRLWMIVGPAALPAGSAGAPPPGWTAFIDGVGRPWRSIAAVMDPETSVYWRYTKDAEGFDGADRGFINDVKFWDLQPYLDMISSNLEANFPLTHTSRTLWMPVDDPSAMDGDAVVSSGIGNGQEVTMEAQLAGPGELTFDWRISSELNADTLTLYRNGLAYESISGGVGAYQTVTVPLVDLPDGMPNLIKWEFSKNLSGDGGTEDRAFLDNFAYAYGYLVWQKMNFPADWIPDPPADPLLDPVVGLTGNPDGDSLDNLGEFAWGTDPLVVDVSPRLPKITPGSTPGSVAIRWTVDTALLGLTFSLKQSDDLLPGSWVDVPIGVDPAPPQILEDGPPVGTLQTFVYEVDPAVGTKFYQVHVDYTAP